MVTFLDLLVVVVMVLCAVSLVAMALMFLVKNQKVKRICLYLVAALGVYMGYVGFRIMWVNSLAQTGLAVALALAAIGAVVLERLSKGSEKKVRLAQGRAAAVQCLYVNTTAVRELEQSNSRTFICIWFHPAL